MSEVTVSPPVVLPPFLGHLFQGNNVTVTYCACLFALFGTLHFTGKALPKFPLSDREKGEWNVRVVSTVNAIVCTIGEGAPVAACELQASGRVYSGKLQNDSGISTSARESGPV